MKKAVYFITYLVVAVIGLLLLIFNNQATLSESLAVTLHNILIAGGIIFILPGVALLLMTLRPKRDESGNIVTRPWISTLIAAISLIWGITMVCMPYGFLHNLNITLGVSLLLAGIAQMVWIVKTASSTFWRFIIPFLVIVAGILVVSVFNQSDNGSNAQIATIISGISFIAWGVNGFISLRSPGVAHAAHEAAKKEHKAEKAEAKAEKAEAKAQAKAAEEQAKVETKAAEVQAKTENNAIETEHKASDEKAEEEHASSEKKSEEEIKASGDQASDKKASAGKA